MKTSSKDRLDKIFLNDVQRKNARRIDQYGINSTFLPGHFKGFTVKLNPLDGVYYCDIRPNMRNDKILKEHIKTIDHFFYTDVWSLLESGGLPLSNIVLEDGDR